jgi:very-short-patch-repair endonuclease
MDLVIECDGNYWHKYPVGNEIDHIRTSELIAKGFKVLRLWESEIKNLSLSDFQNKLNSIKRG